MFINVVFNFKSDFFCSTKMMILECQWTGNRIFSSEFCSELMIHGGSVQYWVKCTIILEFESDNLANLWSNKGLFDIIILLLESFQVDPFFKALIIRLFQIEIKKYKILIFLMFSWHVAWVETEKMPGIKTFKQRIISIFSGNVRKVSKQLRQRKAFKIFICEFS